MRTLIDTTFAAVAITIACSFTAAPVAADPNPLNDSASCSATELDPCYRGDQMGVFAEAGARMVTDYLTGIGVTTDSLPALIFIPAGRGVGSECVDVNGDDTQHDRSHDFCSTDNTVYIGQEVLWDSYRKYRAVAPLSGLAHEYGHFLQSAMHVPEPHGASDTIRNENQADCFSGAFIGHLRDRGQIVDPRDIDILKQYLTATASVDAPGRDHGTARERIDSFTLGYDGALGACNQYYPATPLTG